MAEAVDEYDDRIRSPPSGEQPNKAEPDLIDDDPCDPELTQAAEEPAGDESVSPERGADDDVVTDQEAIDAVADFAGRKLNRLADRAANFATFKALNYAMNCREPGSGPDEDTWDGPTEPVAEPEAESASGDDGTNEEPHDVVESPPSDQDDPWPEPENKPPEDPHFESDQEMLSEPDEPKEPEGEEDDKPSNW